MIVKNVIVNLLFTPLVVLPLSAGINFVQQNNTTSYPSASSMVVAYPAAQTAGNLNIVVVGWNDTSAAVKSITDSRGFPRRDGARRKEPRPGRIVACWRH
jgi:hypothetical protein